MLRHQPANFIQPIYQLINVKVYYAKHFFIPLLKALLQQFQLLFNHEGPISLYSERIPPLLYGFDEVLIF